MTATASYTLRAPAQTGHLFTRKRAEFACSLFPSVGVLVLAGVELIFFLVAGTVLGFGFSVRIMLITR